MNVGTVTRGEQMLALRRSRMGNSPAILRGGFRPFFLGGALWAVIALALWLCSLVGAFQLPSGMDALAWHRHEMLFGFVGAVVAGFLLTAIPNWTGRLPIAGPPLALLFGAWLAARLALLFSASLGSIVPAVLDSGFYVVLAAIAAREVLEANNRNVPIVALVLLFGLVNALDHMSASGLTSDPDLGWKLAIALVVIMISLIGGRIVPSFTRNWLVKHGANGSLPSQPTGFDKAVIDVTALAFLAWVSAPPGMLVAVLFGAASLAQGARLARWKGWRTLADPLVLVLHVGYLWIPVGLALLAATQFQIVPRSAAIHALTSGAMATMILAVMTRATLGHTGRDLRAGFGTSLIYLLVSGGALLRVAASLGAVDYRLGLEVAGAAWISAFLLFLFIYGPILARPRIDGKI